MSTYRNTIDGTGLLTHPTDGELVIEPDRGGAFVGFTPRPEDRPAIALDVLGKVENPDDNWFSAERIADRLDTDEDLAYFAYRSLKALAIRRERATKAEAEAKEAEAQLDREAEELHKSYLQQGAVWRNVARKARELHAEGGK